MIKKCTESGVGIDYSPDTYCESGGGKWLEVEIEPE